jgi:hypothetical protein
MYDWEEVIVKIGIAILLVIALWAITIAIVTMPMKSICLTHGYPESQFTWNFIGYCVRTVNQTQYVVPISSIH